FDIEEVCAPVLQEELDMSAELAAKVVEICAAQAIIVAEQQQKEKEEAERRKAEEEAAAAAVLGEPGSALPGLGTEIDQQAESVAASILGETAPAPATPDASPPSAETPAHAEGASPAEPAEPPQQVNPDAPASGSPDEQERVAPSSSDSRGSA
ncbi:MAG: hypothetical protein O7D97_05325, partial [Planctomycetota bacterium]|nr:hypothetical protein [Planctomycetota bacterium]